MSKNFIVSATFVFLATTTPYFSLAFHNNAEKTRSHTDKTNLTANNGTSTMMRQNISATRQNTNPSCMGDAIEKRDNALIMAVDSKNDSMKAALTARKTSLSDAWRNLTGTTRYKAIREVWKTYGNSIKQTQKEFKNNRDSAWKQFEKEKRSCKTDLRSTIDKTDYSVDSGL